jgi:glyoxylate/hydroxypyruvate/2-ketogluconate reductase
MRVSFMKRPRVLIALNIPGEVEEYIGKYCEYEKWDSEEPMPRGELLKKLKDKDGVIIDGVRVDEEFLENGPHLKVVCNVSVGYNNFDIDAMKRKNVIGTNTPMVLNDTVADLIMGLILAVARRIPEMDKYVKEGNWRLQDYKSLFGIDVHHSTIGIIGMGRIGEVVAKRAKAGFDAEVIYYNRKRRLEIEEKLGISYVDLNELLSKSDYIVLMTPLTKETFHIIDFEEFNRMKKNAIFINASRGQTVNEKALIDSLKSKKILGAGLDVFEIEPVERDNELLSMPNVVTLPHLGSATEKTNDDMAWLAAENLVNALCKGNAVSIVPELRNR